MVGEWFVRKIFRAADIAIVVADENGDFAEHRPWDICVKKGCERWFFSRVFWENSLGLGQSFIDETFTCADLYGMLRRIMEYRQERKRSRWLRLSGHVPQSLPELWIKFQLNVLRKDAQSIRAAFDDIGAHYNEGNPFFRIMQGRTRMYSCAFFFNDDDDLDQAQINKCTHTGSKLDLRPGDQVAEIGCGWGFCAAYLAGLYPGVTFHCFTVSEEQYRCALEEHADLITAGRLKFYLMDYRDILTEFPKRYFDPRRYFDAIFSIGMLEHVGPKHYKDFKAVLKYCIKPHRPIVLHNIVGNGGIDPFIWHYIFRGGILPTIVQMRREFGKPLELFLRERFGPHYAKTLRAWRMNIIANWQKLLDMGYTEEFLRKYVFYLAGCEIGFEIGDIQLEQRTLAIGGMPEGYEWHPPSYARAA